MKNDEQRLRHRRATVSKDIIGVRTLSLHFYYTKIKDYGWVEESERNGTQCISEETVKRRFIDATNTTELRDTGNMNEN